MGPFDVHCLISVCGSAYLAETLLLPSPDHTIHMDFSTSVPMRAGDIIELSVEHGSPAPLKFEWTAFAVVGSTERSYVTCKENLIVRAGALTKIGEIVIADDGDYLTRVIVGPRKIGLLERLALLTDDDAKAG